jgi:hypothetical protein
VDGGQYWVFDTQYYNLLTDNSVVPGLAIVGMAGKKREGVSEAALTGLKFFDNVRIKGCRRRAQALACHAAKSYNRRYGVRSNSARPLALPFPDLLDGHAGGSVDNSPRAGNLTDTGDQSHDEV